jgi:hypothetical protein
LTPMQLPAQTDLPELNELAGKLRAIEPPVAEGCDGSEIERDRGKLIDAIMAIVLAGKIFVEALIAYKRHWPKGPRGRWGAAFKLLACSFGSSNRTLYRFIRSLADRGTPASKGKRKVERAEAKGKEIGQESRTEPSQSPDPVTKTPTVKLKGKFGDELVRQLRARARVDPKVDFVDRVGKMIEMTLPEDGDSRKEEARKIMVALAARLGIS